MLLEAQRTSGEPTQVGRLELSPAVGAPDMAVQAVQQNQVRVSWRLSQFVFSRLSYLPILQQEPGPIGSALAHLQQTRSLNRGG